MSFGASSATSSFNIGRMFFRQFRRAQVQF